MTILRGSIPPRLRLRLSPARGEDEASTGSTKITVAQAQAPRLTGGVR